MLDKESAKMNGRMAKQLHKKPISHSTTASMAKAHMKQIGTFVMSSVWYQGKE